ncbi:MAG: 2'-5' RNA ligase family protein [Thermoleophilia bacterium]|nr:2'-5' RNA ligase family protein [Thermoleophilia bacterium]MDH5333382.1 2'-5' RNA ligase family protein [Thermoleophilia bacterium]
MSEPGSVGRDEGVRLFLALRLPDSVCHDLDQWGREHLHGGRHVAREHLHVTLAFLGRQPPTGVAHALRALRAACAAAPAFPLAPVRWRETRSVGMVVLSDETGAACRLAQDVHTRLEAVGVYRREKRPWLPHVTVLRFRERPRLDPPLPGTGTFVPSDAAAFLSHLHPSGARYEVLESMALGGSIDESR